MTDIYQSIFESVSFNTDMAFSGNYCALNHSLIEHKTGFIHFIKSGRAEIVMPGQQSIFVEKPSLVFFPRPHSHSLRAVEGCGVDLVCARTTFNVGFDNPLAFSFPDVLTIGLSEIATIEPILKMLFDEAAADNMARKAIIESICTVLLIYMTRHLAETAAFKTGIMFALGDKQLSKVLKLMHDRFNDRLTLDDLAEAASMSKSRFSDHFRSVVGQTPLEYLAFYRIAMAQTLLEKNQQVKFVASEVGYESTSAFLRKFKEIVGVTPGEWARQCQSK